MPRKRSKNAPVLVAAQTRRALAVELRARGHTYRRVAELVLKQWGAERLPKDYGERQAWGDVDTELARLRKVTSEQVAVIRQLELSRLDELFHAMFTRAVTGDKPAVDRVLRIMDRRSKLLGLDAPTKIAPTDPTGDNPYEGNPRDELAQLLSDIAARTAALEDSGGDG
jgi:hypothetical protein